MVEDILNVQEKLEGENLFFGKFTKCENIHLTLKFLGEISEEKIAEVERRISEIDMKNFKVRLGNLGVFSKKFVRIVWAELKGPGVFELQRKIDEVLFGLFEKERRFMSHITIARVKKVGNKRKLIDFLGSVDFKRKDFEINHFSLKKSVLEREGPTYEDIFRVELGN